MSAPEDRLSAPPAVNGPGVASRSTQNAAHARMPVPRSSSYTRNVARVVASHNASATGGGGEDAAAAGAPDTTPLGQSLKFLSAQQLLERTIAPAQNIDANKAPPPPPPGASPSRSFTGMSSGRSGTTSYVVPSRNQGGSAPSLFDNSEKSESQSEGGVKSPEVQLIMNQCGMTEDDAKRELIRRSKARTGERVVAGAMDTVDFAGDSKSYPVVPPAPPKTPPTRLATRPPTFVRAERGTLGPAVYRPESPDSPNVMLAEPVSPADSTGETITSGTHDAVPIPVHAPSNVPGRTPETLSPGREPGTSVGPDTVPPRATPFIEAAMTARVVPRMQDPKVTGITHALMPDGSAVQLKFLDYSGDDDEQLSAPLPSPPSPITSTTLSSESNAQDKQPLKNSDAFVVELFPAPVTPESSPANGSTIRSSTARPGSPFLSEDTVAPQENETLTTLGKDIGDVAHMHNSTSSLASPTGAAPVKPGSVFRRSFARASAASVDLVSRAARLRRSSQQPEQLPDSLLSGDLSRENVAVDELTLNRKITAADFAGPEPADQGLVLGPTNRTNDTSIILSNSDSKATTDAHPATVAAAAKEPADQRLMPLSDRELSGNGVIGDGLCNRSGKSPTRPSSLIASAKLSHSAAVADSRTSDPYPPPPSVPGEVDVKQNSHDDSPADQPSRTHRNEPNSAGRMTYSDSTGASEPLRNKPTVPAAESLVSSESIQSGPVPPANHQTNGSEIIAHGERPRVWPRSVAPKLPSFMRSKDPSYLSTLSLPAVNIDKNKGPLPRSLNVVVHDAISEQSVVRTDVQTARTNSSIATVEGRITSVSRELVSGCPGSQEDASVGERNSVDTCRKVAEATSSVDADSLCTVDGNLRAVTTKNKLAPYPTDDDRRNVETITLNNSHSTGAQRTGDDDGTESIVTSQTHESRCTHQVEEYTQESFDNRESVILLECEDAKKSGVHVASGDPSLSAPASLPSSVKLKDPMPPTQVKVFETRENVDGPNSPEKVEDSDSGTFKSCGNAKATPLPEVSSVVVKRVIRRLKTDGSTQLVTRRVRVKPLRVHSNGDVVVRRKVMRPKDDGSGDVEPVLVECIIRKRPSSPAQSSTEALNSLKPSSVTAPASAPTARQVDCSTKGEGVSSTSEARTELEASSAASSVALQALVTKNVVGSDCESNGKSSRSSSQAEEYGTPPSSDFMAGDVLTEPTPITPVRFPDKFDAVPGPKFENRTPNNPGSHSFAALGTPSTPSCSSTIDVDSPKPRSMSFGEYRPILHDNNAPVYVPMRLARQTPAAAETDDQCVITSKAEFATVAPFERVVLPNVSRLPTPDELARPRVPRANTTGNAAPSNQNLSSTTRPKRLVPRNLTFGTFLVTARPRNTGQSSNTGPAVPENQALGNMDRVNEDSSAYGQTSAEAMVPMKSAGDGDGGPGKVFVESSDVARRGTRKPFSNLVAMARSRFFSNPGTRPAATVSG